MSQPTSGYLYPRNLVHAKVPAALLTTGQTTGVNLAQFSSNGITLVLDIGAVSGTTPTANIQVQHSPTTETGDYTDVSGASVDLNATSASTIVTLFVPNFIGPYFRLDNTTGGDTPSFLVGAIVYGNPADSTVTEGYTNSPQT